MSRLLPLATCLAIGLTGCIGYPQTPATNAVNTALTGACFATHFYTCDFGPYEADKAETRAANVRSDAQRNSTAADADAARRASCLTDTGPRLPVSSDQCATYGMNGPATSAAD